MHEAAEIADGFVSAAAKLTIAVTKGLAEADNIEDPPPIECPMTTA